MWNTFRIVFYKQNHFTKYAESVTELKTFKKIKKEKKNSQSDFGYTSMEHRSSISSALLRPVFRLKSIPTTQNPGPGTGSASQWATEPKPASPLPSSALQWARGEVGRAERAWLTVPTFWTQNAANWAVSDLWSLGAEPVVDRSIIYVGE